LLAETAAEPEARFVCETRDTTRPTFSDSEDSARIVISMGSDIVVIRARATGVAATIQMPNRALPGVPAGSATLLANEARSATQLGCFAAVVNNVTSLTTAERVYLIG
jgi:hypothetical protein